MSCTSWIRPSLRKALVEGISPNWLASHKRRQYVTQAVLATPPWVKRKDFRELIKRRNRLTRMTGIRHTLDHIVPLNHPKVCGLNVPWNLQPVPEKANSRKGNAWCDEQGDWFWQPEQFTFWPECAL